MNRRRILFTSAASAMLNPCPPLFAQAARRAFSACWWLVAGGWWLVAGGCPRFAMPPEFVDQCHEAPRKPLAKYDLKGE